MRSNPRARRDQAYLVTEAPMSRAEEISQRQRRYSIMMGIRVVCFAVTALLFFLHAGWFVMIPAVGAITLPYFAVVMANSRRPASSTGFRPYQPRLPDRFSPIDASGQSDRRGRPPAAAHDDDDGSGRPDRDLG